jgi:hypothetical protein
VSNHAARRRRRDRPNRADMIRAAHASAFAGGCNCDRIVHVHHIGDGVWSSTAEHDDSCVMVTAPSSVRLVVKPHR